MNLPDSLLRNLRDIHGDADAWLAELDATLEGLEKRWQIWVTGLEDHGSGWQAAITVAGELEPFL